jgi:hypothetical protein
MLLLLVYEKICGVSEKLLEGLEDTISPIVVNGQEILMLSQRGRTVIRSIRLFSSLNIRKFLREISLATSSWIYF